MKQLGELKFENGLMHLFVDGEHYAVSLGDISSALSNAKPEELNNYSFSPSGFGIHWPLLDEDLSVPGILKKAKKLAA